MTLYYTTDGRPSRYPTNHDHAVEMKSLFYNCGEKCSVCGETTTRYTHDHSCRWCTRLDAMDFYNLAKGSNFVITDAATGKHFGVLAGNVHREIPPEKYQQMRELIDMAAGDDAYTFHADPCNKKAHYGFKRLGKCVQCSIERNKPSARLQAQMDGVTWYTPDTPCKRCGTTALRNVHNGSCKGCIKKTDDNRVTPDSVMMQGNPDMIISRDDAREYGFKVFRTGEACRRGHTGWRYVSTGNCISCLREAHTTA